MKLRRKIPEGNQLPPAADVAISASVDGREGEEEEGGELDDETPPDEERNDVPSFKTKRPTRGGPCPCGSGLVYKKCCKRHKKAKSKRTGEMGGRNATSTQDDDDDGLRDSFQRVIVL